MSQNNSLLACPNCSSKSAIKRGKRKRKLRTIQQFQCKDCKKFFSPETQSGKTYPLKIILKSISAYNLGYNLSQTSEILKNSKGIFGTQKIAKRFFSEIEKKFGIKIPVS